MTFRQLLRSIGTILSPRQRRRYVLFQGFFILAGFLQVVGASSIAPFVALLSRPEIMHTNQVAARVFRTLGFTNDVEAMAAFAALMVVTLAASNGAAAIAVWLTFRFSLDLGADLQKDLLTCYLRRDYVHLAGTNSSELINKITIGAPRFSFNVMLPLMTIANQAVVVLVIVVGLSIIQPLTVVVLGVLFGGAYSMLFFGVKRRLTFHGDRVWNNHKRKHRLLTESLGGLKEIRLTGNEIQYINHFDMLVRESDRSETIIGAFGDIPRFLLETIAFSALLVLSIIMLLNGAQPSAVVAILSLYAVTGYRMLPAAQSIFKAVSQIRSNAKTLQDIYPDVLEGRMRASELEPYVEEPVPPYPAAISFSDVAFTYPKGKHAVLRNVSATLPVNALTVLVGHSGSGKSTLADIMLGLLPPSTGTVTVGGTPVGAMGRQWFKAVGYVPQSIFLLDDTIANNVAFGSPLGVQAERLQHSLELARLADFVAELPEGANFRIGEHGARLSGGQRQRIGLARALYHDANYLLLDEATSALDGRTEAEIIDTLLTLRRDRTVIMIAHRLTTIQAADHIVLLNDGRIEAVGSWPDLLEHNERFRELIRLGTRQDGIDTTTEFGPVT